MIEVNDEDILKIEKVLAKLNEKQGRGGVNLDGFRREAIERFENIGFKVEVKVYETNESGVFAFDLDITDRLEGEFDPDRMVYEATHDILELGEGGVISTEGLLQAPPHQH